MALDTTMDGMDIDMSEYEDPEVARMQREAAEMDAVWIHPVARDGLGY